MGKTLIVSDVHNRTRIADEILKEEAGYDKAIFLGDIWDQFGDTPKDAYLSATWLQTSLNNPKHIHLFGNHCISYAYPHNTNAFCSGFSFEKSKAIREVLNQDGFEKLKGFYIDDGILYTHAGLSKRLLDLSIERGLWDEDLPFSLDNIQSFLEKEDKIARSRYDVGGGHLLYLAGYSRGGDQKVGGIIWEDSRSHWPIKGIKQIFGHTPGKVPYFSVLGEKHGNPMLLTMPEFAQSKMGNKKIRKQNDCWSFCLDTHNRHYAILEDGILTVKEVKMVRYYDSKLIMDVYGIDEIIPHYQMKLSDLTTNG